MKNFKTHLKEASGPSATEWESVIVDAFNGKIADLEKKFGAENVKPAKQIASEIRKISGIGKPMVHYGSARGTLNSEWKGNATPKTDIYAGNVHISLKKAGGSQFMSAMKDETISTFHAACEHMKNNTPQEATKLADIVGKKFGSVVTQFPIADMKKIIDMKIGQTGVVKNKGEEIKYTVDKELKAQAEAMMKQDKLNHQLTQTFKEFFDNNDKFRNYFVYEAATGDLKFRPDPLAASNWLVTWSPDGKAKCEEISQGHSRPGKVIPYYAGKVKINVAFKSMGTFNAKRSSSFRAIMDSTIMEFARPEEPTLVDVIAECMKEHNIHTLSEEYLTEWEFLDRIKSFFSDLAKKVYDAVVNIASKGFKALLEFIGVEVDNVSFDQNFTFSV